MQVAKEDDIREIASQVWEELPSRKIINVFCLGKRISLKIVKYEGKYFPGRSKGRDRIWNKEGF